jgi:hypothetical protein
MNTKQGHDLPDDTEVYITNTIYGRNSIQIFVQKVQASDYSRLSFVFCPIDELWASVNARDYWLKYPNQHPRCTFFGLLYKKLRI